MRLRSRWIGFLGLAGFVVVQEPLHTSREPLVLDGLGGTDAGQFR